MEILDLRQLRSHDLEPLLEEEKAVWEQCLQWDYSRTAAMILRFVEARALTGYAALEAGRAVGYSFYVQEAHKGLIGDVFVSQGFRNGQTEVRLLTHIVETMQTTPGIRRIEAQLMNFAEPPVRQHLQAQNFRSYPRMFLFLPLEGQTVGEDRLPAGTRLEPWDSPWLPEAARVITRAYRGHVDSTVSDQYRSRAGATRFLENIIQYPGCGVFEAECSFLAIHAELERLCGMVLSSVVKDRVAHITQLCVDPEFQKTGVASGLMSRVLRELQRRQFSAITLTVTATNHPALRLYDRLGFSVLKEFDAFSWDAPKTSRWTSAKKS